MRQGPAQAGARLSGEALFRVRPGRDGTRRRASHSIGKTGGFRNVRCRDSCRQGARLRGVM